LLTTAVVFVQWIPVLSFLGRMLFQNGLRFVDLWGDLKSGQQEMCIKAFQEGPEIKVMVSVKQGELPTLKAFFRSPFLLTWV
jgi:hypothetical protein